MSYQLYSFAGVLLPTASPQEDVGTGDSKTQIIDLPNGLRFDPWGSDRAPLAKTTVTKACKILAATPTALDAAYKSYEALRGVRDYLVRLRGDGSQERILARCMQVQAQYEARHWQFLPVTFTFELEGPYWSGAAHNQVVTLDAIPKTVVLVNNGNITVTDAVVRFDIGAGIPTISLLKVGVSGVSEWQWTYNLGYPNADNLIVNCGTRSVLHAGINAYGGFSLTANHKIDDWLRLPPGSTTVTITRTGGNSTCTATFTYNDGWA